MDPASITGLVGTCLSLVGTTAKTLKYLHDLKTKYRDVETDITHLSSQVSTVQSALLLLQKWLDTGPPTLHSNIQLRGNLEQALGDCGIFVDAIESHVSRVQGAATKIPTGGKIRHIWDEEEVTKCQRGLGFQIQALSLLLQLIQMDTMSDQQHVLAQEDNHALLRRAHDDASSYIDPSAGRESIQNSAIKPDDATYGTIFDFDDQALSSSVYKAAFRSLMKKELERQVNVQADPMTVTTGSQVSVVLPQQEDDATITSTADFASALSNFDNPGELLKMTPSGSEATELPLNMEALHVSSNNLEETQTDISEPPANPTLPTPTLHKAHEGLDDEPRVLASAGTNHGDQRNCPIGVLRVHIVRANLLGTHLVQSPNTLVLGGTWAKKDIIDEFAAATSTFKHSLSPVWNEVLYIPVWLSADIFGLTVMISQPGMTFDGMDSRDQVVDELDGTTNIYKHEPGDRPPAATGTITFRASYHLTHRFVTPARSIEHDELKRPLSQENVAAELAQVTLTQEERLRYESGFLIFKINITSISRKTRLALFIDDFLYPSWTSPSEFGAASYRDSPNDVGSCFVREVDFSQLTFVVLGSTGAAMYTRDNSDVVKASPKIRLFSVDILQQSFDKLTPFDIKQNGKTVFQFQISTFFVPVIMDLPPEDRISNMGVLRVEVLGGEYLAMPRKGAAIRTYCKFYLNGEKVFKTNSRTTSEDGLLSWKEFFELPVLSRIKARFEVRMMRWASTSRVYLGTADINMKHLDPFMAKEIEVGLQGAGLTGTIKLRLLFKPGYVSRPDSA